jgi:hypothetical protein
MLEINYLNYRFNSKYLCIHLQQQDQLRLKYDTHSYKYIYQLRAMNKDNVLQYLLQHLEQFNLTLDNVKTWDELSLICEHAVKCAGDSENGTQHEKIVFSLDAMTGELLTHNCEM